jgi:cyclophilin family peptidyl-prolyl cis-trans isomerase
MIFKKVVLALIVLCLFALLPACEKEKEPPCEGPATVNLGNDTIIREGEALVLDAGNPGAEFLWSNGSATQKITVDTSGTYWVQVKNCYAAVSDTIVSDTIVVSLRYPTVRVETGFGHFRIWLYHNTPLHRSNFFSLTDSGFYNGLLFHRVDFNFVIQGGDPEGTGWGGPGYTIPAEIVPGNTHQYGAVGAARLGDDVNPDKESNGSQYYIVCDPNGEPFLNGKYSVFGFVFSGMDVVFEISQTPVDANDRPLEDVAMDNLEIEFFTAAELQSLFNFSID